MVRFLSPSDWKFSSRASYNTQNRGMDLKTIKESRAASFIAVTLVYIIATVVGVLTYNALSFEWWVSLLIADVVATIVTFIFSLIFNNASVYDPYWSVQPAVILLVFATTKKLNALGILLIIVVLFWAVRLTANWAYNFKGLTHQDWRYTMLKDKTGFFYPIINFVGIHMVPTLIVYGCTVPAVYAIIKEVRFSIYAVPFLLLSLLSAGMQGIADIQMHKFRKNRNTPFIRTGLWKHSRHPNYLGEILMWWGVALAVFAVTLKPILLAGAISNTVLFLCVSIPMADKRQSKKEGFCEYKKQTRTLLPIKKLIQK